MNTQATYTTHTKFTFGFFRFITHHWVVMLIIIPPGGNLSSTLHVWSPCWTSFVQLVEIEAPSQRCKEVKCQSKAYNVRCTHRNFLVTFSSILHSMPALHWKIKIRFNFNIKIRFNFNTKILLLGLISNPLVYATEGTHHSLHIYSEWCCKTSIFLLQGNRPSIDYTGHYGEIDKLEHLAHSLQG